MTLCLRCHCAFDNSISRPWMKNVISEYLKSKYVGWDEKKLVYHKYETIQDDYERLPKEGKKAVRDYIDYIKNTFNEEEQNAEDRNYRQLDE